MLYNEYSLWFSRMNTWGVGEVYSHLSSADIMNAWSYTSIPPHLFGAWFLSKKIVVDISNNFISSLLRF